MTTNNNTNKTITRVIDNCEFRWAKLDKPVNPFGAGDAWEIQIVTTEREVAEEWSVQNLNVKSKVVEEGKVEYYVNIKRYAKSAEGKAYDKPVVLNGRKEPETTNIGNGSKGKIKVYQYQWNRGNRSGITTVLIAVQVTELIEYIPEDVIDF